MGWSIYTVELRLRTGILPVGTPVAGVEAAEGVADPAEPRCRAPGRRGRDQIFQNDPWVSNCKSRIKIHLGRTHDEVVDSGELRGVLRIMGVHLLQALVLHQEAHVAPLARGAALELRLGGGGGGRWVGEEPMGVVVKRERGGERGGERKGGWKRGGEGGGQSGNMHGHPSPPASAKVRLLGPGQ